jgi:ABC-type antimicrobial peptide transport system permease subunit
MDVLRVVLGRVVTQITLGGVLGLLLGAALSYPLAAFLFGMRTWDALVYGVVVGTLGLAVAVAALGPALRAVRVDPVVAMNAS